MKILIAHCVPSPRINGMSRMMGFLHDEIAREGHQIEYFCADHVPNLRKFHPGLQRFVFPLAILRHALQAMRAGSPYDIINVHEPSAAALLLFRRMLPPCKIVVTSHGIEMRNWLLRTAPDAEPADRPGPKTRFIYPLTLLSQANFSLRAADHIFCLNEEDRSFLMDRFRRRADSITRMFPAASPVFGQNARNRRYAGKHTLLFAGSWLVRKGTLDLVRAFTEVVRSGRDVSLMILNPGAPEAVVENQFPEDVRAHVICRQTKSETATAAAFEEADVFLLPSLFEGTPLTLIEAMWSGLPIITTATCGMRDVIEDARNGLLVPMRDAAALGAAIIRMLDDDQLRERVGRAAHRDAMTQFRWSIVAQPVLESYRYLVPSDSNLVPEPELATPFRS